MSFDVFQWDDWVSLGISVLAGVLFALALAAYRRRPTGRVLLFTAAFGVLFLKGLFLLGEVWLGEDNVLLDALELVADAATLILFFVGMLKG